MTNLKGVTHSVKKEFRRERCGCDHNPPDDFFKSQWQTRTKSSVYLVYRWIIALFFTAVVINSMIQSDAEISFWLYFIYLTNWGIMMCMITNCFLVVLVSIWHFHPNYADKLLNMHSITSPFRIYWSLHIITLVVSIIITTIYWSVLYSVQQDGLTATNIMTHALNSVLMFIDLLIVAHPLRLLHIIFPILFGLVYAIFSFIYQKCGGVNQKGQPYIYHILDWSKWDQALLVVLGILVLACSIYMVLFIVYKLRLALYKHLNHGSFSPQTYSTTNGSNNVEAGVKKSALEIGIQHSPSGVPSMVQEGDCGFQNQGFASSKESICK